MNRIIDLLVPFINTYSSCSKYWWENTLGCHMAASTVLMFAYQKCYSVRVFLDLASQMVPYAFS